MRKAERVRLHELGTARWDEHDAAWVLELAAREGVALARLASDHGLSPKRLYWWRARLDRREAKTEAAGHFVPVRVVADGPSGGLASNGSGVTVETAHGHRVHVARDFDAATLTRVLDALAVAC